MKQYKQSEFVSDIYDLKKNESIVYPANAYQTIYNIRRVLRMYENKIYKDTAKGNCKRIILRIK